MILAVNSAWFEFAFMCALSLLTWSLLLCSFTGVVVPDGWHQWLAFIIGSCLLPALAQASWSKLANCKRENWNEEFWISRRRMEIKRLLQRQMSDGEVQSIIHGHVEQPTNLLPLSAADLPYVQEFLDKEFTANDELWLYDTGEESWEHLGGEWGFAVVQDGEIKSFRMMAMN